MPNNDNFVAIHQQLAQKLKTPKTETSENLYSTTPRSSKPPVPPKPKTRGASLFKRKSVKNQIPPSNAENIYTRPKPPVPPKPKYRLSLFGRKSETNEPPNTEIEGIQVLASNTENCQNQDEVVPKPQKPWYFHFHRFFIFLFVPLRMCVLYYLDILSDIMQSIGLYENCHEKYFSVSMSIIVSSYMITVLYVKFMFVELSWCESIFYFVKYG